MAVQKIEYENKLRGGLFTNANANEVKQIVNHNADELTALAGTMVSLEGSIESLSKGMTDLKEGQKQLKVAMVETTAMVEPGRLYVWGRVGELDLTLKGIADGLQAEYQLRFTCGKDFELRLNEPVDWIEEPEWTEGWTYEVSIEDGLGVCAGWEARGA